MLGILRVEFACVPVKAQIAVLKDIVHEARRTRANAYEAAIFFMLAQLNALQPDDANARIALYIERHSQKAATLTRTHTPSDKAVVDVLNGIRARHGLAPLIAHA